MKRIQFIYLTVVISSLMVFACGNDATTKNIASSKPLSNLEKGMKIYKKYCVACHGLNGKMGMNGAKDLTQSQLSLTERKLLIANGKNTMTAFKSILDAEEIKLVAEYTMSLPKENE